MDNKPYLQAKFMLSAALLNQLTPDEGREVAFAGRSNAGKSSAMNTLTQQKRLAKTSKTPGRTQLINLFELTDTEHRLVDLPGYGYAEVPKMVKARWEQTLARYLETRQSLQGLILVMDCRHPLKSLDLTLLEWANRGELPTHILLTKSDKLSRNKANQTLMHVKKDLKQLGIRASVQLFSAPHKTGLEEAYAQLNQWLYPTEY